MTHQLLSAANFMRDAFFLSLLLIFIDAETVVPLAVVWLLLSALAAIVSFTAFIIVPYRPGVAALIGASLMSLAFFAGASIIPVLLFALAAIYRLHVRFSGNEEEIDSDNQFLFKFILLFGVVLFISLINPSGGKNGLLYAIAISTVSFYVVYRLLYRFLKARGEGASNEQLFLSILGILGLSAAGGAFVYVLADDVRFVLGTMFGKAVSIALWPLAVLMDKLAIFLSGLSSEEQKQQTIDNMDMEKAIESEGNPVSPSIADFPFELVFAGILLLLLFFLIRRMGKAKNEKKEEKKADFVKIERIPADPLRNAAAISEIQYTMIDLEIVRKAFRDLERAAAQLDKGRKSHETVREWLKRMEWKTTDQFFETYEFVRYGNGQISETKALPFLEEVKKIKEKYLKLNV